MSSRLGEMLIKKRLLTADQLKTALERQKKEGGVLGSILIQLQYVSEDSVARALSKQYGVPYVELSDHDIDSDVIKLVPMEVAIQHKVIPLNKSGSNLTVATADPTNLVALDLIKFMTGCSVNAVVSSETAITQAIEEHYGTEQTIALQKVYDQLAQDEEYELDISEEEGELDASELQEAGSEAPIIKLVNIVFAEAVRQGASDIHLEPYEGKFRVRYRIDGELYDVMTPPAALIDLGFSPEAAETVSTYRGPGCLKCNQSGYKGRIGLYEVLEVTPAIEQLILTGGNYNQIREQARREGMITLRQSGLEKIKNGVTTIDEVLRETREVETLMVSASSEPMVQVSAPTAQPSQPVAQAAAPRKVDQRLQWGMLGTAEAAMEQMIPAIQKSKSSRVTAVAAESKKKSKEAAERFEIDQTYSSYKELLADPSVDAVYVCLPNRMRLEWVIKALESSKHVLCETPLATSEDECREMIEAAHKNDVPLIETLSYRRHPQHQFVRETLAEGELGTIRRIRGHLQSPLPDLASGGGTLMNGGCNLVSLCRWLYQREPEKVSAFFELDPEHEVDISFNGMLDFGEGQSGVLESSFETHPQSNYYEVVGDRGRLVVEPFSDSDEDSATVRLTIDGETSEKNFPATNVLTQEAEAFVSCLRKGGKPLTSADDALQNMKVIEALYRSGRTGKHVTMGSEKLKVVQEKRADRLTAYTPTSTSTEELTNDREISECSRVSR